MKHAHERYRNLASKVREQFLQRARHNALLTIPSLMPLAGHDNKQHLMEPYQGLGASGVTHLSSRLNNSLLPAGRPHVRLDIPVEVRMQEGGEVSKETERGLALLEQLLQSEVEDKGWRPSTLTSLQQLLVAGNVCEHLLPDNRIRVFRLDRFVVRRSWDGSILEALIEEPMSVDKLPEGIKSVKDADEEVTLYTWIRITPKGLYDVRQYIEDEEVNFVGEFTAADLPYNFIRWSITPHEDYGRSFCEEHIGDLRALDGLEKAALEMAAMGSKNFIMVRPGAVGAAIRRRLTQGINGDVIMGDPEGVELKSFDNSSGYQITAASIQTLRQEISRVFLLLSAGQRDAERVTATEIERDIQELEAALGGNFSTLNTEMMEWRTRRMMQNMQSQGRLPEGVVENTRPIILTGLEALSRERDVSRVIQLGQIAQAFGDVAVDTLKLDKLLARAAVGLGFPDVTRTEDEVREIQQERQAAEQAQAAAGPVAGQVARAATEG